MRGRLLFAAFVALASALPMCSSFTTVAPDGTTDGGPDGEVRRAADGSPNDGSVDDGADAAPARCVNLEGVVCVDPTEVTNAQYLAFYESAMALDAAPGCAAGSPEPGSSLSKNALGDAPVVNVSWCEAASFCARAGKHLCGAIGGGAIAPASLGDPAQSEWEEACSETTVAYGSCNRDSGASRPVGSVTCGSRGVSDLVGNVWEWVDSCEDDYCYIGGGGFSQSDAFCGTLSNLPRTSRAVDVGFRCCATP